MHGTIKLTLCFLFLITTLAAQELKVTDRKGTIKTIRNTRVSVTVNEPVSPIEGDIWIDTNASTTKIHDGSNWQLILGTDTSSSVYTGSFKIDAPGGTSNTNITEVINGLPFLPSQVTFVAYTNIEDLSTNEDGSDGANSNSINSTLGTMNGFARNNGALGIVQHVIYLAGHGNSINNISRYSSDTNCIGFRYTSQNGFNRGVINGSLTSFDTNSTSDYGFTLNVNYFLGTEGTFAENSLVLSEDVMVLYTAYR